MSFPLALLRHFLQGASLETMFSALRHSQRTILAIETSEGEVLGSFTSTPVSCHDMEEKSY